MSLYKSEDGRTSFELQYTDFSDVNGSQTFEFRCEVRSYGFIATLNGIWFYKDDLVTFLKDLRRLADKQVNSIKLTAMTDFEFSIAKEDELGHFEATIKMNSLAQKNNACLTTNLNTQSLYDLANEIEEKIQASS